eukprot:GHVQ01032832.1.p1 GENE.GHVQ01032832.1~~GHVQ01032832.1.p1  ORF type:complete len:210 (-),score=22.18 GHVQ01032832.1:134-763(-)
MLKRFGVYYNQSLLRDSVSELRNEIERRHPALDKYEVYVHDYFMDGQPRRQDTIKTRVPSLKAFTGKLRAAVHDILQSRVFPDKVVTYQLDWDKYRVLKGEYDTALHIDHSLQHRYTGYNPHNITLITTWISLNSSGAKEGLSVFFPHSSHGVNAADGVWGSMHAEPGSILVFLETTPHANYTSTKPTKKLRMSVEMRYDHHISFTLLF